MNRLTCISLPQPTALVTALGLVNWVHAPQRVHGKGALWIHANLKGSDWPHQVTQETRAQLASVGFTSTAQFHYGALLGAVDLVDCVPMTDEFAIRKHAKTSVLKARPQPFTVDGWALLFGSNRIQLEFPYPCGQDRPMYDQWTEEAPIALKSAVENPEHWSFNFAEPMPAMPYPAFGGGLLGLSGQPKEEDEDDEHRAEVARELDPKRTDR